MNKINLPLLKEYNNDNFFLLAGPCVVEGEEITHEIARELKGICERLQIPLVFKASYRKANRSKASSFTGIGDREGLTSDIIDDVLHLGLTGQFPFLIFAMVVRHKGAGLAHAIQCHIQ